MTSPNQLLKRTSCYLCKNGIRYPYCYNDYCKFINQPPQEAKRDKVLRAFSNNEINFNANSSQDLGEASSLNKIYKNNIKTITYSVNDKECWICTSHLPGCSMGYPIMCVQRRNITVGKYIYCWYNDLPKINGLLLHICDNPKCINPLHLYVGTPKDNMQDKVKRNRHLNTIGERSKVHKLTNKIVQEILISKESIRVLAEKYNISKSTIGYVKQRKIWKNIEVGEING